MKYRPKLSTIFICIGLFFFFLLFRFPYQNVRGWLFGTIYKSTGVYVIADEIYLSIFGWPGLGMKKVDATVPLGTSEIDISSQKMIFRVGLAGIFPPVPSVSISASGLKKGGDLFVKASQGKAYTSAKIEAEAVALEQFFANTAEAVTGQLMADGAFTYDAKDLAKSSGYLDFSIERLRTPAQNFQGIVFPAISFGNLKAKVAVKNGTVDVLNFQFGDSNSDLQGSIAGEVKLGQDIYASTLNITLKITPSPKFRENSQAQTIISILNSIDDSKPTTYAMKWSTSIQGIVTNLWNALPKKISAGQ